MNYQRRSILQLQALVNVTDRLTDRGTIKWQRCIAGVLTDSQSYGRTLCVSHKSCEFHRERSVHILCVLKVQLKTVECCLWNLTFNTSFDSTTKVVYCFLARVDSVAVVINQILLVLRILIPLSQHPSTPCRL